MENTTSIYGEHKPALERVLEQIMLHVIEIREKMEQTLGMDPVEHCLGRIKKEDSMREKCRRQNLPETTDSALNKIFDAVGVSYAPLWTMFILSATTLPVRAAYDSACR